MIRSKRLSTPLLNNWLVSHAIPGANGRYRLRLWKEQRSSLTSILAELRAYIEEAHDDARKRIRSGFEDALSPFNIPSQDPAEHYPKLLHRTTLQGYFGEIAAVIAIEHWGAHGHNDWIVPAFLFRFHDQEFQHLELIRETLRNGEPLNQNANEHLRPGRTGDDGIAFRINSQNKITDVLILEAKCLKTNNSGTVQDAHEKLSNRTIVTSGVRELVNLLKEYDTPQANSWRAALLNLWQKDFATAIHYDGVAYACGHAPARVGRITWLSDQSPHASYTASRRLEAMEFHFGDLDDLINQVYR